LSHSLVLGFHVHLGLRSEFAVYAKKQCQTLIFQDFRSDTGLYKGKKRHGSVTYRDAFRSRLQPRVQHAKEQLQILGELSELCLSASPNATHRLLVYLFQHKLLRRSYTQNVDGLDSKAGLPQFDGDGRQVHVTLHGSLQYVFVLGAPHSTQHPQHVSQQHSDM
jgi:NAD-dependent SIR2 family protein deacetylase